MNLLKVSKEISYYLRHKPRELSIELDKNWWTNLDIFLKNISEKIWYNITKSTIEKILEKSDKKRFEILNWKIRAKYWHSIKKIELEYWEYIWEKELYHWTIKDNLWNIFNEWLKPQSRKYIHLSDNIEVAKNTANRKWDDIVILKIKVKEFLNDWYKIYNWWNWIYLTNDILPKYLEEF